MNSHQLVSLLFISTDRSRYEFNHLCSLSGVKLCDSKLRLVTPRYIYLATSISLHL
jgi:hypothetical protein